MKLNSTYILLKIIRYKIHHVFFWLVYFFVWYFQYEQFVGKLNAVMNSLVVIVLHGSASYFNNYYLVPEFLRKRKYIYYFTTLVLTISFICLVHIVYLLQVDTIDDSEKFNLWSMDFFFSNSISILYTIGLTMTLLFFKQWFEKERLNDKLEKLNIETELKYLKSQINPHFLFNSLNSVYALTLNKSDKAPEVVLKLSDILRYILYDGGEKVVSLSKEIEYLNNYLELEKIRYGSRLETKLEVKGDLSGHEIAPMIFLPFLENCFKHGVNSNIGHTFINISIEVDSKDIHFKIENNKPQTRISDKVNYQGGIGIENVKKRLNLLYPGKHELEITESETFVVDIRIYW
ncbi:MAG: histidine kinase [Flavobacteriales bacterium]|nr:histidine kinase [Flavobacteriales bacterium]